MDGPGKKLLAWLTRGRETVLGRVIWWQYAWVWALLAAFIAHAWSSSSRGTRAIDVFGIPIALIVVQCLGILAFWLWISRIRCRAIDCHWKVCKHCGYDLRQTEEPGPCPECGKAFGVEELRTYWGGGWKK